MSTLENRINKMRSKADAKSAEYKDLYEKQKQEAEQAADEEAKAFGNEEMISTTTPDETLLHKVDKIQERADKREGVMRSNAEWWEWIKGGMNSAPATGVAPISGAAPHRLLHRRLHHSNL